MNTAESNKQFTPAYLALLQNGKLASRVEQAYHHLQDCDLKKKAKKKMPKKGAGGNKI